MSSCRACGERMVWSDEIRKGTCRKCNASGKCAQCGGAILEDEKGTGLCSDCGKKSPE